MSILSLISFFNAITFAFSGLYLVRGNFKENLNKLAVWMAGCYVVWSFAYTFFYTAPTIQSAWFWHKISSLGWILFCPITTHFLLELSGTTRLIKRTHLYIILYSVPALLLIKTLFSYESPVARGFVQSQVGWGWTYVSNIGSFWFWLYVIYILVYSCASLYFVYRWAKQSGKLIRKKQANSLILLNITMVLIGFFTDLVMPSITPLLPPLFNILSIFLVMALVLLVKRYRLISVKEVAGPDLILATVMDPILMLNSQGIIDKCNQAAADFLRYSPQNIIGRRLSDFYKSERYQPKGLDQLIQNKVMRDVDLDLVDSEGNILNALASFSVVETQLDGFIGVVISLHDMTEYRKLTKSLEAMANYDKLTSLPNRRMFFDRLESALAAYQSLGRKFALVFMDLDGFKAINDTYGHVVGDKLLEKVANMLVVETRNQDTIARIGGDEFILLFSDLGEESELERISQRLEDLFPGPIYIDNIKCHIGISVGVSKCPEDGTTANILMRVADERMYQDKAKKNDGTKEIAAGHTN
ncbi:MAG: diguanylate cyclase domain-containing protein [Ignavibacteriales bacterium]